MSTSTSQGSRSRFQGPSGESRPSKNRPYRGGARKKNGGAKKRKTSLLRPEQLIKSAQNREVQPYQATRTFAEMPLHGKLKKALALKGFERPSEIQDRTFESVYEGRDLLGLAQTGTGKTAAFLIPIIQQLLENPQMEHALILTPTRELARQIEEEFRSMSQGLKLYSACFIGGTNLSRDFQKLRRKQHLIIATPGRLLDLVDRKALRLANFHTLVLDEFDRMLDMGFVNDVKRAVAEMSNRQQTLLFSATLDRKQEQLIDEILSNPARVEVSSGQHSSDNVEQNVIRLAQGEDKFNTLCELLNDERYPRVLLFDETKNRVDRLCQRLNKAGFKADQIHGDKSQGARQNALSAFKRGKVQILVATDVAARGIDVADVNLVLNYQIPQSYDSYIHRIGRTGRAGKSGMALTFVG